MSKKKNIMKEFQISEISAVDVPAQKGAKMVIMKRDYTKEEMDAMSEEDKKKLITQKEEDEDLSVEDKKKAAKKGSDQQQKENEMADDTKAAEAVAKAVKDATDPLKAELEVAKALAAMSDAQKAHYEKQDDAGKKAFIKMSEDERKAEVAKASEANPVVYKSADGTEFRKNDDVRLIAMAKRADEADKIAKAEIDKRLSAEYSKRAESELNCMTGKVETKVAILKAVDGISDEAVKKEALELLKAANASMSSAFQTLGISKAKESGPEAELENMAKAYATKENCTYAKAYDAVLKTAEGKALYAKIGK